MITRLLVLCMCVIDTKIHFFSHILTSRKLGCNLKLIEIWISVKYSMKLMTSSNNHTILSRVSTRKNENFYRNTDWKQEFTIHVTRWSLFMEETARSGAGGRREEGPGGAALRASALRLWLARRFGFAVPCAR